MANNDKEIVLVYVGNGEAIPDVPGRDLTREDMELPAVKSLGGESFLLASKLYKRAQQSPKVQMKKEEA